MLFISVYFLWPWNAEFFKTAQKEFGVPGLDTKFTAQGMANINDSDQYIISGYISDGAPSRFYVVDTTTNESRYFTLKVDGKDYTGHAGGVEVVGSKVWTVSGDDGGHCYCFNLEDVQNAQDGDVINVKGVFETNNGADFVFANDGLLWVGEFYKEGVYDTDASHHLTTTSGEVNRALVFAYEIDQSESTGVVSSLPQKAISVRDLCQGIAVGENGEFIMSTSFSLPDSNIYVYENVLEQNAHATVEVGTRTIPVWHLD